MLHLVIGPAVEGRWLLLMLAVGVSYVVGVLAVAAILGELPRLRALMQRAARARETSAA